MDVRSVKDILSAERKPESLIAKPSSTSSAPRQRTLSTLTSSRLAAEQLEPVQVHVESLKRPQPEPELRARANDVIAVINVASEAADELGKLAKSIDGIVTQVADNPDSGQRVNILEQEANQLVEEIRRRITVSARSNTVKLTDSDARLEVEETLGRTLKALFPEKEEEPFGIGQIQLSPAENIISVRTSVAEARSRIEGLRENMNSAKAEVESVVLALDVAAQNSEAAAASIRDVDQALKVAGAMRTEINANPENALQSIGAFQYKVLNLLRG